MCPIRWLMPPCALLGGLDGWSRRKTSPSPSLICPEHLQGTAGFCRAFRAGPASIPSTESGFPRSRPAVNPTALCGGLGRVWAEVACTVPPAFPERQQRKPPAVGRSILAAARPHRDRHEDAKWRPSSSRRDGGCVRRGDTMPCINPALAAVGPSLKHPKTPHHAPPHPAWEQRGNQRRLCRAWETFSSLLTTCKPFSKNFLK